MFHSSRSTVAGSFGLATWVKWYEGRVVVPLFLDSTDHHCRAWCVTFLVPLGTATESREIPVPTHSTMEHSWTIPDSHCGTILPSSHAIRVKILIYIYSPVITFNQSSASKRSKIVVGIHKSFGITIASMTSEAAARFSSGYGIDSLEELADRCGWPRQNERGYRIQEELFGHERPIRVIHVGAGISGICMAKFLPQMLNNASLVCYDMNNDIGGTWLENRHVVDSL